MNILDKFTNTKVLVVGDLMLDRYWWGDVKRISPEAPVPVVELKKSTYAAGGAANVAANVVGLGATVSLIGCVGNDNDAGTLIGILESLNISAEHIVRVGSRPTSVKTRVIAHSQQVVRVDQESTAAISPDVEVQVWDKIVSILPAVEVVIISDYAKGLLTETLLSRLISDARAANKIVIIDPKGKDYSRYRGASLVTPNRREAAEACNLETDAPDLINICGGRLLNDLDLEMVLITQGEDGMTLFEKEKEPIQLSAAARETYDVTGAGDTAIATMAVALGCGMNFLQAAKLANAAAGAVVEKVGTTPITKSELETIMSDV